MRNRGGVIWLTGLSGSGKTTIANACLKLLAERTPSRHAYLLDGDILRQGLNKDLGFLPADRSENIRRLAEVAKLFADAGVVCLVAAISPYRFDRKNARLICGQSRFVEAFVDCPITICEQRDLKGLYKKARNGELKNFTGIGAPYEIPAEPDVSVQTDYMSVLSCACAILETFKEAI